MAIVATVWVSRPSAMATTVNAAPASLGAIPDGPAGCAAFGATRNVTFAVAGLTGKVSSVKVSFTLTPGHTLVGDLEVFLFSPGGIPHLLFSRTGATQPSDLGSASDATGPYTFHDAAAGNWWTAAGASPIPPGEYRTSTTGEVVGGGALTLMNPAFAGTSGNGTWTLRFRDHCQANTGSVSAASLTLATSVAPVNFDGDTITDFAVVRNTGGGPSGAVTWYWQNSLGVSGRAWGIASDFFVPGDFDGDGKSDVAVWRPGSPSVWYINRSSDLGVTIFPFGQTGDDASVFGDYDGDGKMDPAVYRSGSVPGAPSTWYAWLSATSTLLGFPWGQFGDYVAPGDYDGDGKFDFAVQRNGGGGGAVFHLWRSNGSGYVAIPWGTPSDFIVPGDYDGDGITDIAVARLAAGAMQWHIRRSSDGGYTGLNFGASTDLPVQGDYDGDGKTDVAVWRGHPDPAQTAFYTLWSSNGSVRSLQFGLISDYPPANYNTR